MPSQGNKLFRQEALERLSSPEKLDQMMQVVSPKAWLPLTTIGLLVAVGGVWSVVGRIPLTVTGQGVLIQPRSVVPFQALSEGQISTLTIEPGDRIRKGEVIGTLDQSKLKQQLQQEQTKLAELLTQNQETNQLQDQGIALKRQNIAQQRATLQENLRNAEAFSPILREKSLDALAQQRENIQQRIQQSQALLPTLQQRFEVRRRLQQEGAISQDTVLQAQQQYLESQTQLADLEAQLKQLDRQETEAEAQYLQNLNSVKDIKNQLQNLNVQEAELAQQDVEKSLDKTNQIQETKRRIAQLELNVAQSSKIISPYNGRVLEVAVVPGQAVNAGTRLGSIETEDRNSKLVSVVYFADKDGKQVKPGMTLQVTPSMVKRERYGGIVGEVTHITPFPVTNQDMSAIIGNENLANSLVEQISATGSGAPVQVFAELQPDPTTISGYQWSSSDGPSLQISPGTTAQVRVKIGTLAPISYVIPILRSLTGVY
jgi:HlyD family secretion protein